MPGAGHLPSPFLGTAYKMGGFMDEETGVDRSGEAGLGLAGWVWNQTGFANLRNPELAKLYCAPSHV